MTAAVAGFYGLVLFAVLGGLVTMVLWLRVAAGRSMAMAARLDGTGTALRANQRAFRAAMIASALTLVLAIAAYEVGRKAGLI